MFSYLAYCKSIMNKHIPFKKAARKEKWKTNQNKTALLVAINGMLNKLRYKSKS